MGKKIALVAGIGLLLVIAAVVYLYNKPHASVGEPDHLVSASDLIAEFEQDESAANDKYLGTTVEVTGTITEVLEKENGFVLLLGDSSAVSRVSCTLQNEQDSIAYGLRKGDRLTLRGICTGRLLDVVLVDCNIVNNDE